MIDLPILFAVLSLATVVVLVIAVCQALDDQRALRVERARVKVPVVVWQGRVPRYGRGLWVRRNTDPSLTRAFRRFPIDAISRETGK